MYSQLLFENKDKELENQNLYLLIYDCYRPLSVQKEMYKQVGNPEFDENGLIKKGLIIRHLVLPNHLQNSKEVLKWIKNNIDENVYVSIMAQYFPTYKANETEDINRKLTQEEYESEKNKLLNNKKGLFD